MESINVVIDDEEVKAPSEGEENQLISAELPVPSADVIKTSPGMSSVESLPAFDTAVSAFEDEDNPTNPPKRSWVKLNHPPQQLFRSIEEGRRLRNRVIQPKVK